MSAAVQPKQQQLPEVPVTGKRQSPIDIRTENVVNERTKRSVLQDGSKPLYIDYSPLTGVQLTIQNTGHGWQLSIPDEHAKNCEITGGTLGSDHYRLLQIHAHWGRDSNTGSEHTVNGRTYPCELHLVHWNATKYSNPKQAQTQSKDGLAVIGVFVEIGCEQHPIFAIIDSLIPTIPYKGDKKSVQNEHLDLNQLVPDRHSPNYWFYLGSLTTPPYNESVLWHLMKTPIRASEKQIAEFRKLYEKDSSSDANHNVKENYRDVQDLHGRPILDID
ncbi:carbonic anhydrase 1-like [Dermatophagoides pteronyssinus]|uniref:carbonic anhydrase 1-like n=1 Tax=Dermatophagoides pteronyssinus TaxID=6956 RepID=UPI003F673144